MLIKQFPSPSSQCNHKFCLDVKDVRMLFILINVLVLSLDCDAYNLNHRDQEALLTLKKIKAICQSYYIYCWV